MALPASGQIAFSDVRTEMSQSSLNDYYFSRWVAGSNNYWGTTTGGVYSPVNYLSSGSRWSLSSYATMSRSNLSMSAWYNYDHTTFCSNTATASFQTHFTYNVSNLIPSTMVIMDAGTSNTTWSINISGSNSPHGAGAVYVYYGKPWNVSGTTGTGSATFITFSLGDPIVLSFNYNYTYDSNKGQYIYFVLFPNTT